ncbi:hypothetical protein M011DRAFT_474708 [Sporormia fimetaria CBS 119925]|uniref:Uncharacterized protein n=1 Tax=Sporormia fimetaria CBS 119925 TaxID=1340428 RepID=A0A6A6VI36_9PLEO|nr:hypothetical protein M011DRAFT_474708 [Sporormia fimetaria CBS 119925]
MRGLRTRASKFFKGKEEEEDPNPTPRAGPSTPTHSFASSPALRTEDDYDALASASDCDKGIVSNIKLSSPEPKVNKPKKKPSLFLRLRSNSRPSPPHPRGETPPPPLPPLPPGMLQQLPTRNQSLFPPLRTRAQSQGPPPPRPSRPPVSFDFSAPPTPISPSFPDPNILPPSPHPWVPTNTLTPSSLPNCPLPLENLSGTITPTVAPPTLSAFKAANIAVPARSSTGSDARSTPTTPSSPRDFAAASRESSTANVFGARLSSFLKRSSKEKEKEEKKRGSKEGKSKGDLSENNDPKRWTPHHDSLREDDEPQIQGFRSTPLGDGNDDGPRWPSLPPPPPPPPRHPASPGIPKPRKLDPKNSIPPTPTAQTSPASTPAFATATASSATPKPDGLQYPWSWELGWEKHVAPGKEEEYHYVKWTEGKGGTGPGRLWRDGKGFLHWVGDI